MDNGFYDNTQAYQPGYLPYSSGDSGLTLKEKIQYSLLGIIVIGGAFFIGRSIVRKAEARSEQKKTLEEGSAPTYAKQIRMAFHNDGWPGTNKDALRQAVRDIPDKSKFSKVMASYQKLYNSSMLGDMQKALKSSEYEEMLYIVSAKPEVYRPDQPQPLTTQQLEAWAKRLKAAFDIKYGIFPGTDEDAIKAVFLEIPTQAAFGQVAAVYRSLYGNDLMADLKSELEFWEHGPMMQMITAKPKS